MTTFESDSALVVGVGGLGCPAALALVRAGVGKVVLVDDDVVDASNLHRQILFSEDDVGTHKLDAAARLLARRGPSELELVRERLLPENALALVDRASIVIEGADNFATKFLAADACRLANKPIVHAAAIRWTATVMAVSAAGRPCYRCLFEDVPRGVQQSCDGAGVMGPVVGLAGALAADLALSVLSGDESRFGAVWSYDGKRDRLRETPLGPRPSCALCGAAPTISDLRQERYITRVAAPQTHGVLHSGDQP